MYFEPFPTPIIYVISYLYTALGFRFFYTLSFGFVWGSRYMFVLDNFSNLYVESCMKKCDFCVKKRNLTFLQVLI